MMEWAVGKALDVLGEDGQGDQASEFAIWTL